MRAAGFAFALTLLAAGMAQEAPVPVAAEPAHRQVFENEFVRVYRVEVPVGGATKLHQHAQDYLGVMLGPAEVRNRVQGKDPQEAKFAAGDTRWVAGGFAHVVENRGNTPFRNVTIELLRAQPETQTSSSTEYIATPGVSARLAFENERVRAWDILLEPGATAPRHEHQRPHLVVAVTDLDLRSMVDFKAPVSIRQKAGDVAWVRGRFAHSLANVGDQPARFLSIDFK